MSNEITSSFLNSLILLKAELDDSSISSETVDLNSSIEDVTNRLKLVSKKIATLEEESEKNRVYENITGNEKNIKSCITLIKNKGFPQELGQSLSDSYDVFKCKMVCEKMIQKLKKEEFQSAKDLTDRLTKVLTNMNSESPDVELAQVILNPKATLGSLLTDIEARISSLSNKPKAPAT